MMHCLCFARTGLRSRQIPPSALKVAVKELSKAEAKKVAAEKKAAEESKKAEAESVLKKLLASGMSADEIVAKLQ